MDDRRYGAASNVRGIVNGQTVSNPYREEQKTEGEKKKKKKVHKHTIFFPLLFVKLTSNANFLSLHLCT